MSAAIFGASLLEEVQEESLDQLLDDLRCTFEPEPKCQLGLEGLDRLLDIFRYPSTRPADQDEPADTRAVNTQTSPRTRSTRPTPGLIEFGHSTSSADKNSLLYYLAAISILPKSHGGNESTIVWLDTEISFSATKLHQTCIHHLTTQTKDSIQQATNQILTISQEALKHVHVFSISSSRQLLSTLDGLEDYLLGSPTTTSHQHYSQHRPLSLLILNPATAFHHADRFDAEIARLESPTTNPNAAMPPHPKPSQLLSRLKHLQSTFNNTCIYTTNHHHHLTNPTPQSSTTTPSFSPWTLNATLSLTMSRVPVPQFASHMGIEACLQDRGKRQEVVGRGRVRVAVDEEWLVGVVKAREARHAVRRLDGGGAFVVQVLEEGMLVE